LEEKRQELQDRYNSTFRITGIASRRLGWLADPNGLSLPLPQINEQSGAYFAPSVAKKLADINSWLSAAQADILFEATSLNIENGEPAISHIKAALEHGAHAITANKGPIVHGYRELRDFAAKQSKRFLFESTVMDGIPIFSLFPQLPAIHLQGL